MNLRWEIEDLSMLGLDIGLVHALKKRNVFSALDTAYVAKKGERKWLAFFPTHAQSVNDKMFRTKKAAMAYALAIVQLTQ